ncbi:hypothetical protein Y1Q_0015257 [Alligator mississippiensis]|uniref:Ig-like domain-containing protein n=1 Tax=Alligator mississippiensis TaxID=8496 RepID=A0A151NL34_ALLMI|nr:hypothetical protein Y1Q_0015257 [Alligator mississippiensis]
MGCAVRQSLYAVVREREPVKLTCSQEKTQMEYMYWYKQATGEPAGLQMVAFSIDSNSVDMEKDFQGHFKSNRNQSSQLSLSTDSAWLNDSGTYYCAKQKHTLTQLLEEPSTKLPTGSREHTFC